MSQVPGLHLQGEHLHVDDPEFPLVGPDMWKVDEDNWVIVDDPQARRKKYRQAMKKHRASPGNTFKPLCKQFIANTMYKEVEGAFYIPPVDTTKVSFNTVEVNVLDEHGKRTDEVSTIDFAYTPLKNTAAVNILTKNALIVCPRPSNDVRVAPEGHMAASGARAHGGDVINYRHTHEHQALLSDTMSTYLRKHGFGPRVNALRQCLVEAGARSQCPTFGKVPWFTLTVCSCDYSNECHVDTTDGSQAITIWHEHKPRKNSPQISNWYFLFPDIRVMVDGVAHKGLAIPLCHGAVISWEAQRMRHCTAKPNLLKPSSLVWGTHFGAQKRVLSAALKHHPCRRFDDPKRPLTEKEFRDAKKSKKN